MYGAGRFLSGGSMPLNFSKPTALGRTVEAPKPSYDLNSVLGLLGSEYGDMQLHEPSGMYRDAAANQMYEKYEPPTAYKPQQQVYNPSPPPEFEKYDYQRINPVDPRQGNMMYPRADNTGAFSYGYQAPHDYYQLDKNTIQNNNAFFRPYNEPIAGFSGKATPSMAYIAGLLGSSSPVAPAPSPFLSAPTSSGPTSGMALKFSAPKA